MRQVVGTIEPFKYIQQFYLLEDKIKIKEFTTSLENIADNVIGFAKANDVTDIVLRKHCPMAYVEKYADEIKTKAATEYSNGEITVTIM